MRIRIDHHTSYLFEAPVSLSPHLVRTFPRTEPGRLVQSIAFKTNADADVQFRRDIFDNNFARCYYPEHTAEAVFDLSIEIDLQDYNPFHFLLDYDAANFPFQYRPEDAARLSPCLLLPPDSLPNAESDGAGHPTRLLPLPFWETPACGGSTVSMVLSLIEALHQHIAYESRDEGTARPPAETLKLGSGACRDVAVLLAAILRELGLAARLASGYICELDAESSRRRADGAMHMWTEVYLPGAGWTGLDATNGILCNHNFITTAIGLTTAEITPISGRYYGKEVVASKMTAKLEISLAG